MKKPKNLCAVFLHCLIAAYGLSMVFLFYRQTQWSGGSVYESDLPAHIRMIVEDGWYYSLTAPIYQALYLLPFRNLAIAVFLALCGVAAVYLTSALLKAAWGEKADTLSALFPAGGLLLNFVMPCYVRGIADGRYIGMEAASIWHNSTYIVMKPLALCCMLYYGKLSEKYQEGLSFREWLCFSLLLSVCTAVKPSFLLVFAPVLAVFLLWDLLHGTAFRRIFVLGAAVFPALFVVLFQNMVLFGENTGNGWELRPGYALSLHSAHPFIAAALSILFPLAVLFWNLPALKKDRGFLGAWLMAGVGFLELFLFCETGERAGDGNFMWGYSFAILMIFAVCLVQWGKGALAFFDGKNKKKQQKNRRYLSAGFLLFSGLVFLWHVYCGIYFYTHLLQGVSYYMWD